MSKNKLCRWKCGRQTDRRCGICLECCNERDRHDSAVTAGSEVYLPPDHRPGHRFYERKQTPRTEAQKAAATKLGNASKSNSNKNRMPRRAARLKFPKSTKGRGLNREFLV
jgi:hypothetical protein